MRLVQRASFKPLDSLRRETYALPVDIFRVLVGVVSFGYFLHLLLQASDFTDPAGLIDHTLLQTIYPYTGISLFRPGTPPAVLYGALTLGGVISWGLILGWRPKVCALILFLTTVSHARWNFIVLHVGDTLLILMLFWMMLLPIGYTLVWTEWKTEGASCWRRWRTKKVPGGSVATLLVLVRLGYLIAAGWKWTAPMWRSGFALYATLKLPFAYPAAVLTPDWLPLVRVAGCAALLMETTIPLLYCAPTGHPAKRFALLAQVLLHGGIILLLPLPAANLLMLGTAVLFFSQEFGAKLKSPPLKTGADVPASVRVSALVLLLFALSVTRDIPLVGVLSEKATAVLWVGGLYENFRLFDWIAEKNYRAIPEVTRKTPRGEVPIAYGDPSRTSMRMGILAGYLVGDPGAGSLWIPVPWKHRAALKNSILHRGARRFCAGRADGIYTLWATLQRIRPHDPDPRQGRRFFFIEAECAQGRAALCRTYVDPYTRTLCSTAPQTVRSRIFQRHIRRS